MSKMRIISSLALLVLTGCSQGPTIINEVQEGKQLCWLDRGRAKKLTNPRIKMGFNETRPTGFGIKKIDDTNIKMWFVLYDFSKLEHTPTNNPNIIIKTYDPNGLVTQIYRLSSGKNHSCILDGGILSKSGPFFESSDKDIWPRGCYLSFEDQKAVSFQLHHDQLKQIAAAQKTEILIETRYHPLTFVLDDDDLTSVVDFKNKCLS